MSGRTSRRALTLFGLSFLDVISCSFGAMLLLFVMVWTDQDEKLQENHAAAALAKSNVGILERALQGEMDRAERSDRDLVDTFDEIVTLESEIARLDAASQLAERQREALAREIEAEQVISCGIGSNAASELVWSFPSDASSTLFLVDTSESMRRFSPDSMDTSTKWRQVVKTLCLLTAGMASTSRYGIVTFSSLPGAARWQAPETSNVERDLRQLRYLAAAQGTNHAAALNSLKGLLNEADQVIVLTDGYPTMGPKTTFDPNRSVTLEERRNEARSAYDVVLDHLSWGYRGTVHWVVFEWALDREAADYIRLLAMATGGSATFLGRDAFVAIETSVE